MYATMVEATLRVVANALFSQDFGPLVHSMNDLATRGCGAPRGWADSAYGDCCRGPSTTRWPGARSPACRYRRH